MSEQRIRNISANQRCHWCIDGLAEIGTRPEGHGHAPMYAPCPYCEAGARLEFPTKAKARWPNGYWQGRDPAGEITPPPRQGTPLPTAMGARLSREMVARLGRRRDPTPRKTP